MLMSASENNDTWVGKGYNNLSQLSPRAARHEESKTHIDNMVSFSLLGSSSTMPNYLSEAYQQAIDEHNTKVTKNLKILDYIVTCILLLGKCESPLRGHDESDESDNKGMFKNILEAFATFDGDLMQHLQNSTVFRGESKTIQNEILDISLQIYRKSILSEVSRTEHITVMADDTTDTSCTTQMSMVLRYIKPDEHILVERFWGLFRPGSVDAEGISNCILEQLEIILQGDTTKLISQVYDGASVMSGHRAGVQAKIKARYPNTHFSYCYAHKLNLTLQKSAMCTKHSKIFFAELEHISTYFSRSPERLRVLKKHIDTHNSRIPRPSSTRWNFKSRLVKTVAEHKDEIIAACEEIQEKSNLNDTAKASGVCRTLKDENFLFWLSFFSAIFPHVEVLFQEMQSRQLTVDQAHANLTSFKKNMASIRNDFITNSSLTQTTSRIHLGSLAKRVCDEMISDLESRYKCLGHIMFIQLFDQDKFVSYVKDFPVQTVKQVQNYYSMIDGSKLSKELETFYSHAEIHTYKDLSELLKLFSRLNLIDTFKETTKLARILVTMGVTTSEAERCFSCLKRIKTFLRNTMSQERLNSLCMLSIEKSYIHKFPSFKEKIVSAFVHNKNRRMDFVLKKTNV